MGTWRTFPLRILKASWGIAVDLRARSLVVSQPPPGALAVRPRVLLDVTRVQLPAVDIEHLMSGLNTMASAVEAKEPNGYVVIEVDEVKYTPTDYQPEGLAVAMIGWISEEFELDPPMIDVRFDKKANRYIFT